MSFTFALEASAEHGVNVTPYIVAAIVFAMFALAGVVVHSFRDVAHRGTSGAADAHQQPEHAPHH